MEIHVKPRLRGPHMDWPFLAVHFFLNDLTQKKILVVSQLGGFRRLRIRTDGLKPNAHATFLSGMMGACGMSHHFAALSIFSIL